MSETGVQARRTALDAIFRAAVAAAHPAGCLPKHLPAAPANGRLILLAAGKAGGSMAEIAEAHYRDQGVDPSRIEGVGVARHG